jgi:hypothetical protein
LTDRDPKPLIDRNEAFRLAERAVDEFAPTPFFEDERVGVLLEAVRLYCDTLSRRAGVPIWDQALAVAERLHAQRVVDEAAEENDRT